MAMPQRDNLIEQIHRLEGLIAVAEQQKDWAELERRKVKSPEWSVLICDGESEISEQLARIVNGSHQRCQWHTSRDLYFEMWQDGGNRDKCKPFQDRLNKIMAIEPPKEDFEKVSDEDKKALADKADSAEKQMDGLIADVRKGG